MSATREEWLAARERLDGALCPPRQSPQYVDELTEAALGFPCPPEELPVHYVCGVSFADVYPDDHGLRGRVWVTQVGAMSPGEVEVLAYALVKRAKWARKQGRPSVKEQLEDRGKHYG